ncbi:serine protease inhibitor 42Dd-like [Haematobia irritans]|uniref:serine protease inhibitor 42Dd-like n=1 Tax=Haematobia irritans TaxID=7368 RepID=UPI003F4FD923
MNDIDIRQAHGGAQFTMELIKQLEVTTTKKNTVISPFSIQTCMAMVFTGTKGKTSEEIANVMKYVSNSSDEVSIAFRNILRQCHQSDSVKIANKVYLKEGYNIKSDYASTIKENYYSDVESIDFGESQQATKTINTWVMEKTSGKICNLIANGVLNNSTRILILNALHFKGEWQRKFLEEKTMEDDFWINSEESIKLPYMNQKGSFNYAYFDEYNCQALEMPYKDSELSMFAILPRERDGLKDLAEKLQNVNLLDLSEQLCERKNVIVQFPKFRIEYTVDLAKLLEKMGIRKAFDGSGDFSNLLDPAEGLSISNVIHKACIEVNEEGTEAAAATACRIAKRCAPRTYKFVADHPFLYWIWDKKTILFAGAFVNDPNKP